MNKNSPAVGDLRVVELVVENYMGVQAVQIRPTSDVVLVEGRNGAGKSTVIDSIWVALAGLSESGEHPLRDGTDKGRSYVDLGDLRVERKFTKAGSYLEVSDANGHKIARPQEFLDQFYSKTTIDPRNFIGMKPADRKNLLLELTGRRTEIDNIDQERKDLYDERTMVNRDIRVLQGKLAGRTVDAGAVAEVPISGLLQQLEASIAVDNKLAQDRAFVQDCAQKIARKQQEVDSALERIKQLEAEVDVLSREIEDLTERASEIEDLVVAAPESQTAHIREQVAEAERANARVRANKEVVDLQAELASKTEESEAFTSAIGDLDARKTEILHESALSIGTVDFDGDALLVDGKPFDDLSTSEQLWVSLQIAVSQNPTIRVVRISDGNVFDSANMRQIEKFAREHKCQLWIERVADKPDGAGFFIRDGNLVES